VIVNPRSAAGSTRGRWAETASDLRTHFGPFSVAFTKGPGDAVDIARRGAASGRRLILACGGDGTINEVANGILNSGGDAELGVIPSGTGGDFRRSIGIPTSIRDAARLLRDGRTELIDVGRASFTGFSGEPEQRYFVNVASFGLAAAILKRVKGSSSLSWMPLGQIRGRASFALSTLQEVVGIDAASVRVKIDDRNESSLRTVNFCIANARYFGGGMKIAPDARLNDGMLDVINIGDMGTNRILSKAHTLYRGTHTGLPEVKSVLAKRIEASSADPDIEIRIETDGELPGKLPAVFEVVPAALRIRVPSAG
jgi:YegS/Rv2252/BmrU family lipid kinase